MAWPGGGMMSMKRFTDLNRKQDNMKLMDAPMSRGNAACWLRLCAIEDILGDDYDLDRLRELAQADKEGASPCTFCRFNPPSSRDGKPCCMCPAEAALRKQKRTKSFGIMSIGL